MAENGNGNGTNGNGNGKLAKLKWDGSLNVGSVIQLLILGVTLVMAWSSFDKRLSIIEMQRTSEMDSVRSIDERTERIERYLLTHDPHYLDQIPKRGD
jgi:hypothetical protein